MLLIKVSSPCISLRILSPKSFCFMSVCFISLFRLFPIPSCESRALLLPICSKLAVDSRALSTTTSPSGFIDLVRSLFSSNKSDVSSESCLVASFLFSFSSEVLCLFVVWPRYVVKSSLVFVLTSLVLVVTSLVLVVTSLVLVVTSLVLVLTSLVLVLTSLVLVFTSSSLSSCFVGLLLFEFVFTLSSSSVTLSVVSFKTVCFDWYS